MSVQQFLDEMRTDQMLLERVHTEDRDRLCATYREAAETSGRYCVEFRAHDAQGKLHYFKEIGRLIHDEAGGPRRVIGTIQDMTE